MGNIISTSRPLNLSTDQLGRANNGVLFASFEDVWEGAGEFVDCCEAFENLAKLRRGKGCAPDDIRRLAEVCSEAWDKHEDDRARKHFLQVFVEDTFSLLSEKTGMGSFASKPQGSATEVLSKREKKAAGKIVNMFGARAKHEKTRAHQLPDNRACNVFWGMVCEALSGIGMDDFTGEKKLFVRTEMARILPRFHLDLFAFAQAHNSFYDLLEDSLCVMLIPLFTLEQIANWKQGEAYDILVCCSSEEAHRKLGTWRSRDNLNHMKWEDDGDLELATEVLTAHIKALADSLNIHWDCYHNKVRSKHTQFEAKKEHMIQARKALGKKEFKVEVPQKKKHLLPCWCRKKKFFKICLGELYNEDEKKLIPDPSLFAFKAAVNWSGRTPETRFRKLLSCCSPPDESDDESNLSGPPFISEVEEGLADFLVTYGLDEKVGPGGLHMIGREVKIVVTDSEDDNSVSDVSSVGEASLGGEGVVVSDGSDY